MRLPRASRRRVSHPTACSRHRDHGDLIRSEEWSPAPDSIARMTHPLPQSESLCQLLACFVVAAAAVPQLFPRWSATPNLYVCPEAAVPSSFFF